MPHLSPGFTAYLLTITALLGLVFGSFLNCFAWRLAHGESVAKGRSRCPLCGHTLGAGELIPLLSYAALRGRCRHCGGKIPPRYPAVELLAMLVFLSLVLRYDFTLTTLRLLVFACLLLVIALVDLEIRQIPDRLLLAAIAWYLLTLPMVSARPLSALWEGGKGAVLVALPLLLFVLLADRVLGRESMGGGDIKLFFTAGLYLGLPLNVLNLILSCLLGVIFGLACRPARAEGENPGAIPFGPAAAAGIWLTLLCGNAVLTWYLSFF